MLEKKKLAILSNVNLDLIIQSLKKEYHIFEQEGYGQWIQYMIDSNRIKEFAPLAVYLVLEGNALFEGFNDENEIKEEIKKTFNYIKKLSIENSGIPIYISNIDIQPKKIIKGDSIRPEYKIMDFWEEQLEGCLAKIQNLHLFDLRTLIATTGREVFYSDKMWYMGSIPYSIKGMNCIENRIKDLLEKQYLIRKKVLVLDLDNTLWGGVIGEDGLEGIQLSNSLIGAVYRDTQNRIKELTEMGVLLTIASKNNETDVLNVLKNHPQMVLRENDFVAIYANWKPKSNNIVDMANKLNLGLDSFVFLDDNPVEREEVRLALPQVTVSEFPKDISNLPATIRKIADKYFFASRLTDEDLSKTVQYKQEAKRQKALEVADNMEDYLKSLQINILIEEMKESQIERVSQLTQKTNQFNLLTARYTLEQLIEYVNNKNNSVFVANVSDKYGDSGLVFVLMISKTEKIAQIDNLLMSCRVMGRYIEDVIIDEVENALIREGIEEIRANYIATERNSPVAGLMERLGYEAISNEDGKVKNYKRVLGKESLERKLLFKAKWKYNNHYY